MKTNLEMRREALATLREGGWLFRLLAVALLLGVVQNLALTFVGNYYVAHGLQTWPLFLQLKAQHLAQGLDFAVPSAAIARQMHLATAFYLFVACLFGGIQMLGTSVAQLRAVRRTPGGWLGPALVGFRRPLDACWLAFRLSAQIALWALLLVVPGVIAFYRYRQAFRLMADHPDWGAGQCLAESARLMRGHKADSFSFDMSFWRALLALFALAFLYTGAASVGAAGLANVAGLVFAGVALWVSVYYAVGQAVFFEEISKGARTQGGATEKGVAA